MVDGYLFPLFGGTDKSYYDFITHFDEIQQTLPIWHKKFKTLDIPTTIIRWAHDKILVWSEQIPVLAELLDVADQNIHLLDSGAHFIQEEIPNEIVDLIGKFMK